jgi:hypothetical protein
MERRGVRGRGWWGPKRSENSKDGNFIYKRYFESLMLFQM